MSGKVFDTKKHTNIKRRAAYRRIRVYTKSLAKTKAEKTRRRQVLRLWSLGVKIKHISEQLGISERTIKRDLSRITPYIKKKRTQFIRRQSQAEIVQLNSLSPVEQLEYIHEYPEQCQVFKSRKCRDLTVTIDIDKAFQGQYPVKFKPNLPVDMLENGKITLELMTCGKKQAIARIYLGKIIRGQANLQTNQSLNASVKPTLKGLRIIETQTIP